MPPKTKEEQTSNLVRVRNNQRRSRARRRDYVAELERKIHECKTQGISACTPCIFPQDTILRLERENKKLRELLALAGVEQAMVDTQLAVQGGVAATIEVNSGLQTSAEASQESLSRLETNTEEASMDNDLDEMLTQSFLQFSADEFDMISEPFQALSSSEPSYMLQSSYEPSLPCPNVSYSSSPPPSSLSAPAIHPLCPPESFLPSPSQSDGGTTLCSVAYELVLENNKRGVDMVEIGIRLWNGFVKGEGDCGCKVENKVLFGVLNYIKG